MATETTDKAPGVDTLAMEFATLLDVTAERLREMDRKDLACGLPDAARHMRKMAQRGVTEREAVERERKAFVEACEYTALNAVLTRSRADAIAAERWPLPKVTRPRVETDQYGDEWKYEPPGDGVVDGTFYWRSAFNPNGAWDRVEKADTQVVPTLARLLAQPTEEVTP